jgi:hypothetical protein
MAVISVLIAACQRFVLKIWSVPKELFRSAFAHPRFANIALEFFTEAAVLVFVFPILDKIVQFGPKGVTLKLGLGSVVTAFFFLFIAGIIGGWIKDKH